jgi:hypothetical protein
MIATVVGLAAMPSPALAKSCSRGYVNGKIGGAQKCLRAGEFCSHRFAGQYHRYGFNCVLYRKSGDYRLQRRSSPRVQVVRPLRGTYRRSVSIRSQAGRQSRPLRLAYPGR